MNRDWLVHNRGSNEFYGAATVNKQVELRSHRSKSLLASKGDTFCRGKPKLVHSFDGADKEAFKPLITPLSSVRQCMTSPA